MALKIPARKVIVPQKPVQIPAQSNGGFSADDGFAKARSINDQRQREFDQRKNRPIEFNMKIGEGGINGVTVVLLDTVKLPNMPYFQYAHRWGFEQNKPQTEICIQDDPAGCGLCRQLSKKGGYEMVLTCIDPRPFTYQKGPNQGKTVQRSKKPLIIKTGMIPAYERLYKTHKTFRGMVLNLHRDGGKNSPGSGSSAEYVKTLSEAELAKMGDLAKQLDYKTAYPRLTAAKMDEIYQTNDGAVIGSDDFKAGSDDIPF